MAGRPRGRSRKRRGARKPTRYPAFFEAARHRGPATLCEISYSGARLEAEKGTVEVGEPVRVYLWPANRPEPFELAGHVVGLRPEGFAIEFDDAGQEVCHWIDWLHAALAATAAGETPGRAARG